MSADDIGATSSDMAERLAGGQAFRHDAAPVPLLAVGVGLLALAGFLHGVGSTAGSARLPLWFLFLGMGVIVLGGGVAALLLGSREPSEASAEPAEATSLALPAEEGPAESEVPIPEPVRSGPEPPEPPRPSPSVPALRAVPSSRATKSTLSAEVLSGTAAASREPSGAQDHLVAITPSGSGANTTATAPGPPGAGVQCATCGRALPSRDAWRRCQNCSRPLCRDCLTSSVRRLGIGYCADCAATAR